MKVERPRARLSDAPTRLNSRSTRPSFARCGGHEAARLGEHDDQRVLAQEGRLAAHVRAGDQPEPVVGSDSGRSLATKRSPDLASAASTTGWRPPSTSRQARRRGRGRHQPPSTARSASAAATSMPGERVGGSRRSARAAAMACVGQLLEMRGLGGERMGARLRRPGSPASCRSGELKRTTPGQRLAVGEARFGRHQRVGVPRRHLDMIAEHGIVADLERRDAGRVAIARLERGDRPAPVARRSRAARRAPRHSPRRYSRPARHRSAAMATSARVSSIDQRAMAVERRQAARTSSGGRSGSARELGRAAAARRRARRAAGRDRADRRARRPAGRARGRCRAARAAPRASRRAAAHRRASHATRSSRASIAPGRSAARARSAASSRAPAPVTVRSIAPSRLPSRVPGHGADELEAFARRGVDRHMIATR